MTTNLRQLERAIGPVLRARWPYLVVIFGAMAVAAMKYPEQALLATVPFLGMLVFGGLLMAPTWTVILLLLILYNPLVAYARLALEPWSYGATFTLLGMGLVALALKRVRPLPRWWVPIGFASVLFCFVAAVSALWGLSGANDPIRVLSDFLQVFELPLVLWVSALALWSHGSATRMIKVAFWAFLVSVVWELVVYSLGGAGPWALVEPAALQPAKLPTGRVLAGFSVVPTVFFPVLLSVLLVGRQRLSTVSTWMVGLAFALSGLSVVLSFKRSVWIGELLGALLILTIYLLLKPWWMAKRTLRRTVGVALLIVVGVALVPIGNRSAYEVVARRAELTLEQLGSGSSPGIEARRLEYLVVLNDIRESPLLGRGLGREFVGLSRGRLEFKHFIHNTYLAILHRMGLAGLSTLLALLLMGFGSILLRLRSVAGALEQAIALGCVAGFATLAVHTVTTGLLLTHPVALYAGASLGVAMYLVSGGRLAIGRASGPLDYFFVESIRFEQEVTDHFDSRAVGASTDGARFMKDGEDLKVLHTDRLQPRVAVVVGTRPGIIKMSPLIRELQGRGSDFVVLHTGQHYSPEMDRAFFVDLKLAPPDYHLDTVSRCHMHGEQTAEMLRGVEESLLKSRPRVVLVCGDANTNLAAGLAARKLGMIVGHVEAGLRSWDWSMPEEHNRIILDHICELLFAPTEQSRKNLLGDAVRGEIHVVGNTVVDAVRQNLEIAKATSTLRESLRLTPSGFLLCTVHREENVDVRERLESILESLGHLAERLDRTVLFPMHPRTKKRLERFSLGNVLRRHDKIRVIEPVGYLDFLLLLEAARLVLTDSGGVQEESCILNVPCVTLRDNTERPETVEAGANRLAGVRPAGVLEAAERMLSVEPDWVNPFGDGNAAERIIDIAERARDRGVRLDTGRCGSVAPVS